MQRIAIQAKILRMVKKADWKGETNMKNTCMKLMCTVLTLLMLFATALPTTYAAADGDFTIRNGVLTKYKGPSGDVIIPDGVREIGERAFEFKTGITSVRFPESLERIDKYAFMACFSARILNLPSGVTYIGHEAFDALNPNTPYEVYLAIWRLEAQLWLDPESCVKLQSAQVTAASDEIVSGIEGDYDKAAAIAKWVSANIAYDYDQLYGRKPMSEYSPTDPEGVLNTRMTTCLGYALLTEALLNAQSIPAIHVSGLAGGKGDWGGHAWNEAYVDGRWIHMDTTFGYSYFDMPLEKFAQDHILWSRPVSSAPKEEPPEPERQSYRVIFDANGGTREEAYRVVENGEPYGALPGASRDGYIFEGWYTAPDGGSRITKNTIVQLTGNQTLYARWREDPSRYETVFRDVPRTAWFYDAVQWVYEQGITTGTGPDTFSPFDTVTRGQAVTFLWRAAGKPRIGYQNNPFVDVSRSDYYYDAVLWASSMGIVRGTSYDHFSPGDTCSVAHIITYLYRARGVGRDGWYEPAVAWAGDAGLVDRSIGAETYAKTPCTRANVAQYLYLSYGNQGKTPQPAITPSVSLSRHSLALTAGDAETLSANVIPADAKVTWSSSNTAVATVSSNGTVTATGSGTASVRASISVDGKTYSDTCTVTVSAPSIWLSQKSLSLTAGESSVLTATTVSVGQNVTWKSSNTNVATMNNGQIKAMSAGTAEVTASVTCGGKTYSDVCTVSVNLPVNTDWTTEKLPEIPGYRIETELQYRYRVKETTTSTNSSLAGWTLYDQKSDYSEWGEACQATSQPTASDTLRIVGTSQVYDYTVYTYYHWWGYGSKDGKLYNHPAAGFYQNYESFTTTDPLTCDGYSSYQSVPMYKKHIDGAHGEIWYLEKQEDIYHTVWEYQTRMLTTAYCYYRWDEWSAWQGDAVSNSANADMIEMEVRTLYRYQPA